MWEDRKVFVILPAYNEEKNIKSAIDDFVSVSYVDEVIAVNNNSTDNTVEEIKKTKAILINEYKQGYGYAIRRGLKEAKGDYMIIAEPDGTFMAKDVIKLLIYADDFDLVLGTRTSKTMIWKGANMGLFLKWGNWFVAKLLEMLFNGPSLTDMGCTMRLIKRDALEKIYHKFTVGGSHFLPEMVILAILSGSGIVEIPVNYKPRVGISKITGEKKRALMVGLNMTCLILRYWIVDLLRVIAHAK